MRVKFLVILPVLLLSSLAGFSTHLRAADILVEQECNSLRYRITVRVYLNTLSNTPFGGFTESDGHLNFGDNSPLEIILQSRVVGPHPRPDLGEHISVASYTTVHTFAVPGTYKITYFERDRSGGILNIPDSHDVAYTTFVVINAQRDHCNVVPVLQVAPIDRGCRGVVFYHSAGATDTDGDSLSYELTTPSKDALSFVDGFISPVSPAFYSDFAHGNESGTAPPTFRIDAITGLITWDAPGRQGEYNIAFKIIEWRYDPETSAFFRISESIRDMQIVVEDCMNARPLLTGPADVCIEAGQTLHGVFKGMDPDNHDVKIELFSPIFDGTPAEFPATYEPHPPEFRPSEPPAEVSVEWNTDCLHVRDQAYQVVAKITDNPPSGPKLVTFLTWNIRVIAPRPEWKSAEPELVNRTAKLEWNDYACANAEKIQLWRRVGSFPFSPGECVAGLSVHKGYTLIREFDPSTSSFTDDNEGKRLVVGAQYCYRLVAIFPLPAGGKSYVSTEVCVGPILADAPVMTNVSVDETAKAAGVMRVSWTKPFDISVEQYPEPYQYEVYRSDGAGGTVPVNVSGRIDETTFSDASLNTEENAYTYQVVLYSRTQNNDEYNAIDTSAMASSVRLALEPGQGQIALRWSFDVPWSNVTPERPRHRIYRGEFGDSKGDFVLYDSVDVSEFGFEFIDRGSMDNPIRENIYYCYFVETIGSYGNARLPMLFNHSQIACSYPVNNLPPCVPVLVVDKTDCEQFLSSTACDADAFENTLSWSVPDTPGCRQDIVSFNLYASDVVDGEMVLVKSFTTERSFTESVSMLARCYRITGTDTRGVESDRSEISCNENCPYFMLPNVFSPNDDGCNDLFASFLPETNAECPLVSQTDCPRFVHGVHLRIVNRWGRPVYEYRSDALHPITIDWDGRDQNGNPLDPGLYFYIADVQFITADPSNAKRSIKGWVNLVR